MRRQRTRARSRAERVGLPLPDDHAKPGGIGRGLIDKEESLRQPYPAGIDIAQCHNGVFNTEQFHWTLWLFGRRADSDGETQSSGLGEIVCAAFLSGLLLCRRRCLAPVHNTEEQGG